MRKRTARAILSAIRTMNRAETILDREYSKLEESGEESGVKEDIGWAQTHVNQAWTEGLDHHCDDAEAALETKGRKP